MFRYICKTKILWKEIYFLLCKYGKKYGKYANFMVRI